jgi:alpha-glucosidase
MALPGSMYIYQGEELGLPEVEDIPAERRQDPMYFRSGGVSPGRDGCRVPLPWSGDAPPFGFSPAPGTRTWLDQPADWAGLTAAAQSEDPASMLALYRDGLRLRRLHVARAGTFAWRPSEPDVLAFTRGERFSCVVNLGARPVALPAGATVLLSSSALEEGPEGGLLPQDATAWVHLTGGS